MTSSLDEQWLDLTGDHCNALSLSPSNRKIAVAGRDVFKIASIDGVFQEQQNLRVARSNLTWSCTDVDWHPNPTKPGYLATGSTNSQVVVWDLESSVPTKPVHILKQHTRTVNRVQWSVQEPHTLLSASQDSEVILWDVRTGTQAMRFADRNQSPVRDIKFSRHVPHYFIAAHESGVVQQWDMRKNGQPDRVISAHHELVLTVDWHPTHRHLLATGSRDKTVKVWNLNDSSRPVHTIQTIGAVHRVMWRPGCDNHLATCALLLDSRIHVWDVNRPFIPIASLLGHRDDVTGIQWRVNDSQHLLSCSKHAQLRQHYMKNAYQPFKHIRPYGVAWGVDDTLSVVGEPIDRDAETTGKPTTMMTPTNPLRSLSIVDRESLLEAMHSRSPAPTPSASRDNGVVRLFPSHQPHRNRSAGFDVLIFKHFAENYRFFDDMPINLCRHNAEVANHCGETMVAKVWEVLCTLLDPYFRDGLEALMQESIAFSSTHVSEAAPSDLDLERLSFDSEAFVQTIPSAVPSGVPDLGSPVDPSSNTEIPAVVSPRSVVPPIENTEPSTSDEKVTPPPPPTIAPAPTLSVSMPVVAPKKPTRSAFYPMPFAKHELIEELLEYLSERGDVQTCAAVSVVLGPMYQGKEELVRQWHISYIELLQRLQMWTLATEFIYNSEDKEVKSINQRSTSMSVKCPSCRQPLTGVAWKCPNCKFITSPCSLCHQTVKGLYAWCQGCGHGGHLKHMKDWFANNTRCPVGCDHVCDISGITQPSAHVPVADSVRGSLNDAAIASAAE